MSPSPYDKFLVALRATRKARNMTQEALAREIKLSRAQYTAIECGRSVVNFVHLHNLSVALRVRFVIGDVANVVATRFVS